MGPLLFVVVPFPNSIGTSHLEEEED